jgi:serine/threonine-protein kinase PknK
MRQRRGIALAGDERQRVATAGPIEVARVRAHKLAGFAHDRLQQLRRPRALCDLIRNRPDGGMPAVQFASGTRAQVHQRRLYVRAGGRKLSRQMTGERVVLADDDVLVREGLALALDGAGFEVVGQAGDAVELTDLVRHTRPDLAIIDIRMPPTQTSEGLDAARAIRAESPHIGILLLSAYVEVETAIDLLADGERIGYLLKSRVMRIAEIADALERIAAGGAVVDPALVSELVEQRRQKDPLGGLTARELEVLGLMAEGRSNGGIASQLFVTEGAVEKHIRSILAKLQLPATDDRHRRVLAVLAFLETR